MRTTRGKNSLTLTSTRRRGDQTPCDQRPRGRAQRLAVAKRRANVIDDETAQTERLTRAPKIGPPEAKEHKGGDLNPDRHRQHLQHALDEPNQLQHGKRRLQRVLVEQPDQQSRSGGGGRHSEQSSAHQPKRGAPSGPHGKTIEKMRTTTSTVSLLCSNCSRRKATELMKKLFKRQKK